jgi:hypothetical protein
MQEQMSSVRIIIAVVLLLIAAPAYAEVTTDEFAREVNLAPFKRLTIQHHQTLKTFETFSRQTLSTITGRASLDGRDASFTVLDMAFRPDDYFAVPWRASWDAEGGGPTLGHGIHQMDLLLSILGEWREVVAVAARRARPTQTEDVSAAIVTFESGVVATIINSLVAPRETSYLRFDLAHATVELEHLYGYSDTNWRVTGAPGYAEQAADAWAAGPKGTSTGHRAQYQAVFEALAAGAPPPVTLPEARASLELVAACYASAFTRAPVARGELDPSSPFYHRMDGTGAPWEAREAV